MAPILSSRNQNLRWQYRTAHTSQTYQWTSMPQPPQKNTFWVLHTVSIVIIERTWRRYFFTTSISDAAWREVALDTSPKLSKLSDGDFNSRRLCRASVLLKRGQFAHSKPGRTTRLFLHRLGTRGLGLRSLQLRNVVEHAQPPRKHFASLMASVAMVAGAGTGPLLAGVVAQFDAITLRLCR